LGEKNPDPRQKQGPRRIGNKPEVLGQRLAGQVSENIPARKRPRPNPPKTFVHDSEIE